MFEEILTKDIEKEIKKLIPDFQSPVIYNGQWSPTRYGTNSEGQPNNSMAVLGCLNRQQAIVKDWSQDKTYRITLSEHTKKHPDSFKYLLKKGIPLYKVEEKYGIKVNDLIVIPIMNPKGEKISSQRIKPNGDKRFAKGGKLPPGHFFKIKGVRKVYCVCEGFADAVTINLLTGAYVYVAFSKGNMDAVVEMLSKRKSKWPVVYCLDNDGDNTLKPKVQSDRVSAVKPHLKGDFNDHRDNPKVVRDLRQACGIYPKYKQSPSLVLSVKSILDDQDISLRYNTRTKAPEVKGLHNRHKWDNLTDTDEAVIFNLCNIAVMFYEKKYESHTKVKVKRFKIRKQDFRDVFTELVHNIQVDPFKQYLTGLKWDKKERLSKFFPLFYNIKEKEEPLVKWAFKSILLGAIWRTFHPGHPHDEMLILQGKQGIGKSKMLEALVPYPQLYSDSVSFLTSDKDFVTNLSGLAIAEVAELDGLSKRDIAHIKRVITTSIDKVTLKYDKYRKDIARTCIFVGTTNNLKPIPEDTTGVRRFPCISIQERYPADSIIKRVKENRDQFWAEAMALYRKKASARMPKELWELSAKISDSKTQRDETLENALQTIIGMLGPDPYVHLPSVLKVAEKGLLNSDDRKHLVGFDNFNNKSQMPFSGGFLPKRDRFVELKAGELLDKWGWKKIVKKVGKRPVKVWVKK